jgi:hypothetical protein
MPVTRTERLYENLLVLKASEAATVANSPDGVWVWSSLPDALERHMTVPLDLFRPDCPTAQTITMRWMEPAAADRRPRATISLSRVVMQKGDPMAMLDYTLVPDESQNVDPAFGSVCVVRAPLVEYNADKIGHLALPGTKEQIVDLSERMNVLEQAEIDPVKESTALWSVVTTAGRLQLQVPSS